MSDLLRVYLPVECDAAGVPLDWDRCRGLDELEGGMGSMHEALRQNGLTCPSCGGHGSLKAAALADFWPDDQAEGRPVRCQGCGHPRSEGTWEAPGGLGPPDSGAERRASDDLRLGGEPTCLVTHFSRCDEGCRHDHPPARVRPVMARVSTRMFADGPDLLIDPHNSAPVDIVEASWRPVDVRTLSWPHDLRPEHLAILCLRCWAER